MASTDIAYISAPTVKWALDRLNTNAQELSARLKTVKPEHVEAWRAGTAFPTFSQAEKLAAQLRVPLAILFMPEPPKGTLPVPDLRTVAGTPAATLSADFFDTIEDCLIRQRWYHDFQVSKHARKLPFIGKFNLNASPKAVAIDMAESLGVDDNLRKTSNSWGQFYTSFIQKADDLGVLVMRNGIVRHNTKRKLSVMEFRGFVLLDPLAPVVFINSADSKAAQIFTLAHELAHLWVGQGGISDLDLRVKRNAFPNDVERLCNSIAAELLVPEERFDYLWSNRMGIEQNLQRIASFFRVSSIVTLRRAYELNKLSYEKFVDLLQAAYDRFQRRKDKDEESSGNFWNTFTARSSPKLVDAVVNAVRTDTLPYREAASLLGLKVGTLSKFVDSQGKG